MTKQQKMWLGVGALAVVAVALFAFKKKKPAAPAGKQEDVVTTPECENPAEVMCKNSNKCYDPNANYLVDPCA